METSRRNFLKATATGMSTAALAGLGSIEAEATQFDQVKKWDSEAGVVVLGTGAAGLLRMFPIPCRRTARMAGISSRGRSITAKTEPAPVAARYCRDPSFTRFGTNQRRKPVPWPEP